TSPLVCCGSHRSGQRHPSGPCSHVTTAAKEPTGTLTAVAHPRSSVPQLTPSPTELDDLELMQLGALGPDARFGPSDEGPSLVIPREIADEAPERIQLTDPEGTPVGTVTITDTYPADDGMGISGDVAHTGEVSTRPFHNVYVPAIKSEEQ